jgi:Sulfatase
MGSLNRIRTDADRTTPPQLLLDYELMQVLRSIDLKQNIVVITADHGESIGEDEVFRHGTRMSEIQMRTPCVMVGAGIKPRKITTATAHYDILPTLLHALAQASVPIENCQGRDLIADPSPADEVGLAPANGPLWEGLLIVRGRKRMAFITDIFGEVPSFEFAGLVDQAGQYELKVGRADSVRHVLRMKR